MLHWLWTPSVRSWRCWVLFLSGLVSLGVGIALMIRANIGLGPWDVLHQGISMHTGIPIGMVTILVGFAVMVSWFPLKQRPGIGTILNILLVGVFIDLLLPLMPTPERLVVQLGQMLAGVVIIGIGAGLYLSAELGTGPRDGLMMGLVRHTNRSIHLVRTTMELLALVTGWLLGGTIGLGTIAFALGIGPTLQATMYVVRRMSTQESPQHASS